MSMLNVLQWSGELSAHAETFAKLALRATFDEKPTVNEIDLMNGMMSSIACITTAVKRQLEELEK